MQNTKLKTHCVTTMTKRWYFNPMYFCTFSMSVSQSQLSFQCVSVCYTTHQCHITWLHRQWRVITIMKRRYSDVFLCIQNDSIPVTIIISVRLSKLHNTSVSHHLVTQQRVIIMTKRRYINPMYFMYPACQSQHVSGKCVQVKQDIKSNHKKVLRIMEFVAK